MMTILKKIQNKMNELIDEDLEITRHEVSREEAVETLQNTIKT